jgi:hypothetical protein
MDVKKYANALVVSEQDVWTIAAAVPPRFV